MATKPLQSVKAGIAPYIKALRVKAGDDIAAACDAYPGASGICSTPMSKVYPAEPAKRSTGR
jgi:hypothetical protein